jgi:hypothetical protein
MKRMVGSQEHVEECEEVPAIGLEEANIPNVDLVFRVV